MLESLSAALTKQAKKTFHSGIRLVCDGDRRTHLVGHGYQISRTGKRMGWPHRCARRGLLSDWIQAPLGMGFYVCPNE